MAYEMQLRETRDPVKLRNPWAVALLPVVTLGVYHVVWWYRVNRELRDFGRARGYDLGQSPAMSALAVFPGGLVVVPALVTYWRGTRRMQQAARLSGREPLNGWIALVLFLVLSLALWAYMQASLNQVWRAEAEPAPGAEPPPPPSGDGLPPRIERADEQTTTGVRR